MFFGPFPLCVAGGPRLVPYSFFLCFWDLFPPSCCRWAEQESCRSNQLHDHDQRYNRCTFKSPKSNKFTFSPQHKLNSTGSQFLCPRDVMSAKFICKFVKDLVFAQFSHWHPPPCYRNETNCHSYTHKELHFGSVEKCRCGVKRMYLTFQTFSTLWFPLLISLGLYCLCDGL